MHSLIRARSRVESVRRKVYGLVSILGFLAALVTPAGAQCPGDCDGIGTVTIAEILTGISIALGEATRDVCPEFDLDGDEMVSVAELVAGLNALLDGCPATPTPTHTPSGPSATPTSTDTPGTPTATPSVTPTREPGMCGDGVTDFAQGETCDDGNTDEGIDDDCPATCRIATCTASGSMLDVDVSFAPPTGVDLAAIQVFFRYPEHRVRIPGRGGSVQVLERFSNLIETASYSIGDQEYGAAVFAFTGGETIPPGRFFTTTFDVCQGATPPEAGDFTCTIAQTSPQTERVVCTVTVP